MRLDRKTIFRANAPDQITNKNWELRKSFFIHPDATSTTTIVRLSSLQTGFLFLLQTLLCLPRFSYARFMLFLFNDDFFFHRERERTFKKKRWFEVNFSDRLTFYGRNSPILLFRVKSETDWDRPGMTKWKTATAPKKSVERRKKLIYHSLNTHLSLTFFGVRDVSGRGRMSFLYFAFLNLALFTSLSPSSSPSNYFVSHNVPTAISDTNKSFRWNYERSGFISLFLHSSHQFNALLILFSSDSRA